jgi:flavorubredoxin
VADYHDGLVVEAVGADDTIDLGDITLRFMPAPMVHWPDSMFTYCPEDAVLMCNDAFGQHLASAERFADEVGVDLAIFEAGAYYANILLDLGPQILKIRGKVSDAGWDCNIIAPSHGVIWRGDAVREIFAAYDVWNKNLVRDKVVVAYGTMWGSTDQLAHVIADALIGEGVDVDVFDLGVTPYAQVMHALLDARGLLVGTPTLHRLMLPKVAGFMANIAGLKPSGRVGASFGSYGWSSGATAEVVAGLEKIGITVAQDSYTQKYRPTEAELEAAKAWAQGFARAVKAAGEETPAEATETAQ